ncbi:MAG: hypothetical protein V4628_01240 [Pseudomonadota bacterium]
MISNKHITVVASVIVAIAVAAGLYVSGSPGEQRLLRLDEKRLSDLLQLSYAISNYWDEAERLPAGLSALVDGQRLRGVPADPESGAMYIYEPGAMDAYRLCAEFARASIQRVPDDFWAHEAGRQCFALEAGPER